ncbi:hypothetical protein DES41_102298 [Pseudorhodoferax soli]|uniref:Molecular chaperone DnaJ n=1 Tax=Pseudorhodoferax soli TaxID=545864 RepID=A0A368Y113_9BURK|nr:hypothetical protein DES41_102298 [Pseudorhodoferax soli]
MPSTSSPSSTPQDASLARPGDETPAGTPQSAEGICPRCGGSGRVADAECPNCAGSGTVTVIVGDA